MLRFIELLFNNRLEIYVFYRLKMLHILKIVLRFL